MKSTAIDMIFLFKVKEGKQDVYEKNLAKQLAITTEKDPGVTIYDVFKNADGIYCQHERYENEEAVLLHMKNTQNELALWFEITEMIQLICMGQLSDDFLNAPQAKGMDIYLPYNRVDRKF